MQLTELNTDIISELLLLLTQFTRFRHRILKQNLQCVRAPRFLPKDLKADEFSEILNHAITEYIQNQRLILRDTETMSFGPNATVMFKPVPDPEARKLLKKNKTDYVQFQNKKIQENTLNERIAKKLLCMKREMNSCPNGPLTSRDMV